MHHGGSGNQQSTRYYPGRDANIIGAWPASAWRLHGSMHAHVVRLFPNAVPVLVRSNGVIDDEVGAWISRGCLLAVVG